MKPEDLSPYDRWQLETKGNILNAPQINPDGSCETESGSEEMQRFSEWNNQMEQQQLLDYEKTFYE